VFSSRTNSITEAVKIVTGNAEVDTMALETASFNLSFDIDVAL